MERPVEVPEFVGQQVQKFAGEDHETLDECGEHDEGERDPDQRVHDTEDLPSLRQRCDVTIPCKESIV